MKRKIEQWKGCEPNAMLTQSEAAMLFALEDAKADILELHAENARFRNVMRMIAYPRRGTAEEGYGLMDIAKLLQSAYSSEQLSDA